MFRRDSCLFDAASRSSRRTLLVRGGLVACALSGGMPFRLFAQSLAVLDVAYAGSMGSVMEGPVKKAALSLGFELHGKGQGANALAQLIAGGSITPDVFLPITASPLRTVFQAGKASTAVPFARTEMVIAYNARSRFAPRLDAAARGAEPWWRVLQEPGLRFGRSDPAGDPQGRNVIFTMMLAEKLFKQPGLVHRILGDTINREQIHMESSLQAQLQSGAIDAASAYRISPGSFHLPFISLPAEVNLSGDDVHARNPDVTLSIAGTTYFPEPLIYYASVLKDAGNAKGAAAFVAWLKGTEAQAIFRQAAYGPPGDATDLSA